MISIESLILIIAILLFLSVIASKISDKFGVPALLLFLVIGMLAGSEAIGGIHFENFWVAKSVGVVSLIFILFSGGFGTQWKDIRHVLVPGLTLSTFGVLATALLVGAFATVILKFSLLEGMLLGAIVSSTDAAAVFNVLRSKNVSLRGKLRPLLEFESGSNDPMAVFLTISLIRLLNNPDLPVSVLIPSFFLDIGVGALAGLLLGRLILMILKRIQLAYEGLYPVFMISLVMLAYSVTTLLKGNGFLAVYMIGIIVGNGNFIHKKSLMRFHEGVAWLMQIVMFLALGLLVFPSRVFPVMELGLLISLFLMFVARPVSVFLCLALTRIRLREKLMVSWTGLRGAVPIILAIFPMLADVPQADVIFNMVFFIVLTSILLQGTTIPLVSRLLKVDAPFNHKRAYPIEFEHTGEIDADLVDLIVPYDSKVIGMPLFRIGIPPDSLVVLISRDDKFFIPNGATVLQGGDVLLVLANKKDLHKMQALLSSKSANN